jgi:hypothetical protein
MHGTYIKITDPSFIYVTSPNIVFNQISTQESTAGAIERR